MTADYHMGEKIRIEPERYEIGYRDRIHTLPNQFTEYLVVAIQDMLHLVFHGSGFGSPEVIVPVLAVLAAEFAIGPPIRHLTATAQTLVRLLINYVFFHFISHICKYDKGKGAYASA